LARRAVVPVAAICPAKCLECIPDGQSRRRSDMYGPKAADLAISMGAAANDHAVTGHIHDRQGMAQRCAG